MVFCCFATVLQQATFLTAIFLRKTCRLQLCQGRFVVVGEQTCNLTVPVWSFAGFALFFATLLPFGRLGKSMFPSKVCRHSVLLLVFTYFQADGVRFFVCRWVAVRVGAGFALFFATPLPLGRLGNCMFPSKVCRRSVVFFVCGVFSRKMCCKRFL